MIFYFIELTSYITKEVWIISTFSWATVIISATGWTLKILINIRYFFKKNKKNFNMHLPLHTKHISLCFALTGVPKNKPDDILTRIVNIKKANTLFMFEVSGWKVFWNYLLEAKLSSFLYLVELSSQPTPEPENAVTWLSNQALALFAYRIGDSPHKATFPRVCSSSQSFCIEPITCTMQNMSRLQPSEIEMGFLGLELTK